MFSQWLSAAALLLAAEPCLGVYLFATHYNGTVTSLELTKPNGSYALTRVSEINACGVQPSWLTLDPANGLLYCVGEGMPSGTLSTISYCPKGVLSETAKVDTIGGGVNSVKYGGATNNSYVAIAHYGNASISTFALPIKPDTKALQNLTFPMDKPGPNADRQTASHPHQVIVDPTGKFLLSPDLGADLVRVFAIDQTTGLLETCPALNATGGSGPRHATFWTHQNQNETQGVYRRNPVRRRDAGHDDSNTPAMNGTAGWMLFVGEELTNQVSGWKVEYPAAGCMAFQKTLEVLTYNTTMAPNQTGVGEIRAKDDYVYVSNRNDATFGLGMDSIAIFPLDPGSGNFTGIAMANSGGEYPRTFEINKKGDLVAVGAQADGAVHILSRDIATGKIGAKVASFQVGEKGRKGEGGLSSVVWGEETAH